ncbi:hypothetical protein FraQA3DRAFT_2467 [Frankia sp. QA3]|nr:hypothetical protein FraQA3DRAFT_2467 [Frankia sp. QA3]
MDVRLPAPLRLVVIEYGDVAFVGDTGCCEGSVALREGRAWVALPSG